MTDKGSKFYYSRLSNGEKNIYDKMCGALLRFEPAPSGEYIVVTEITLLITIFDKSKSAITLLQAMFCLYFTINIVSSQ